MTETRIWNFTDAFSVCQTALRDGHINHMAKRVFSRGHCHSLALALMALIDGAELYGSFTSAVADHVYVRIGDKFLDVLGLHTEDEVRESAYGGLYAEIEPVDELDLADWEDDGVYCPNRKADAMSFARALIAENHEAIEDALASVVC